MIVRALLAALALSAPASAAPVGPWTEAVVSVRDLGQAPRLFTEVGGWRVVGRGRLHRSELAYWRLPAAASGRFVHVCAPAADTGCIRFVSFRGVPQRAIRRATRPWDTGGIFSLMLRSNDVNAVFDRAMAMGWWAETEPWSFHFAGSDLRNVVLAGPDGFNVALYERSSPPFTAFPVGRMSQAFNAMRMVRDQQASAAWHRRVLGFATVFQTDFVDPAPTDGNFSIPRNYATRIVRRAAAMQPSPGETGRVELMQFVGFEGRDMSTHATPPNLGILSLRFPVRDLAALRARVAREGGAIAYEAPDVRSGQRIAAMFAVRDPDGSLTEFYQAR